MRKLPPLNALKALESAARLGSFSRAAEELCVTHGAISKQIDQLEGRLGIRLFHRTPGGVSPTEACRSYQTEIGAAFDAIVAATAGLMRSTAGQHLQINAPPTFTIQWLVPRLSRFQLRYPSMEIRLDTTRDDVSVVLKEVDVVIRRGPPIWRRVHSQPFLAEAITPVCAPAFIRQRPIRRPTDLAKAVLLFAEARPDDWRLWFQRSDAGSIRPRKTLRFDHSSLALEAAKDGMGIAIGPLSMIQNEIRRKALVPLFPDKTVETPGYFSICASSRHSEQKINAFNEWLVEEGADRVLK
jgi:LysR family glycine cleavage system transcriptional activator